MYTFLISVGILIAGYLFYGLLMEKIFGVDKTRTTPAFSKQDGVDYVPLPWYKIFLIQFLNIAGLGPIFGAIAGAMWGPSAFLWIVFGSIFGGAVHDYMAGMMSVRLDGLSLPEIIGKYLGKPVMQFMRAFTVMLMVLVGAVFIMGPAGILAGLTPGVLNIGNTAIAFDLTFWAIIVFIYYFLATMLPIDKLIGRIYPIFGFALLFMAAAIIGAILFGNFHLPELTGNLYNQHIKGDAMPIFPMMFISIACGAISGFHATQSPLMARCIKNEKYGRRVFYGAMITEGILALIWAAAAMAFFGGVEQLNDTMIAKNGNAAWVVNEISNSLLGRFGAFLAILGVVAAPITSGDTAFRSARLIVADFIHLKQKKIANRLLIASPLFLCGFVLTQIDFGIIWRYMAWSNQTLATITLWAITVYLLGEKKLWLVSFIPAVFMTMVASSYIFFAPEGLQLPYNMSIGIGAGITFLVLALFFVWFVRNKQGSTEPLP
ncbi:MAG: carbon starvation protein CstA [Bacteroidetes bacterium GWF2_43_63]|nr:MAG: carbon starvation protein CstA [Bacteroidetes bacterium GWE2_42_42]OFY54390.1 MAG: carbon starvation protein CstA [Bacteroidetes bacterium GWF2_43_63]HBG69220.1 carbon starvation protein A [Bacteroidales bacterium]HCB61225.1 carbon starvation protein A [Bacteroidales bacterium]HCY24144.1 carbon starvation protein A [Bacteroidales bacterium]